MINSPLCRGAVAQLGERLHGMQEVVSSNLISSTAQPIVITWVVDIISMLYFSGILVAPIALK